MNKFNLQEHEKNQILSMYNGLIMEQETPTNKTNTAPTELPVSDQLKTFVRNGCVKNGEVVPMKSTDPRMQFAIKQESTKTPGKFRYFFIDYTVGMTDETGKYQTLPNKWKCETKTLEKNIGGTIEKDTKGQFPEDQKDCQAEIESYYTNYTNKRPMSDVSFNDLKNKVQACKNEFYGDWKFLSGGRRIDKILDIMSGSVIGQGPSKMGDNAQWRLK
jgi:hypothetical protein